MMALLCNTFMTQLGTVLFYTLTKLCHVVIYLPTDRLDPHALLKSVHRAPSLQTLAELLRAGGGVLVKSPYFL